MFVGTAYAMAAPPGAEVTTFDTIMSFFPLIILMGIFYFFLFRPQQKKQKAIRETLESLKEGDSVITQGGIFGSIVKIKDDVVTLQIAEGVRVKIGRGYIVGLRSANE
ncbi:MAG: preprotein translocase subunit YajC [Nitrospinae bacterium]|nr:preprotein translocase subunit YajC [Nitrospinota bacterium]